MNTAGTGKVYQFWRLQSPSVRVGRSFILAVSYETNVLKRTYALPRAIITVTRSLAGERRKKRGIIYDVTCNNTIYMSVYSTTLLYQVNFTTIKHPFCYNACCCEKRNELFIEMLAICHRNMSEVSTYNVMKTSSEKFLWAPQ
jgi:hypothetical protein